MTDSDGNILWQNDHTPFGEETGASGFVERDGFYTGKKIDRDTGLYYFNARWYDPQLGRFITEDPVKDGVNWYSYVGSNPLRFIDPTGLRRIEWDPREKNKSDEYERQRKEYNKQMDEALAEDRRDIDRLDSAMRAAGSIGAAQALEERKRASMEEYNRFVATHYPPDDVSDYGGTKITGSFEEDYKESDSQDPHPGIDFTGGSGFETPFYTELESSNKQSSNPIVLAIIGTPYRMRVKHGDTDPVNNLKANIEDLDKSSFSPGQQILPYPTQGNPEKYDPHFHVEIRTTDPNASSPMVNPIGLTTGKYSEYLFDFTGNGDWAPMSYDW